jgi:hypothetical protein
MPPTIIVTVGVPETLLTAFDPLVVEPLELQAARPAASAAALAALAILMTECLDIEAAPALY